MLSRTRSRVALSAEAVTGYRDAAEKVLLPVNKPPWVLLGCSHCHVRRSEVILLRVGGARGRGALPLRLELRALLRCRIQQSVAESRVELRRFPLPKKDWAPMSRVWDERIDQRIAELKQLKIDIVNCTCGRTKASARGR